MVCPRFACLPPGFPAVPQYLGHTTVRSRLLADPDLECYTIRLPVRVIPDRTGVETHRLPAPASSERRSLTCLPQGHRHADRVKRAYISCHGRNPSGVGPCISNTLSQTATPLLGPHYRVPTLVWVAPTSMHPTRVLALTLVHGCPPPTDQRLDLPGYRVFSMSGSTRPRTPGVPAPLAIAQRRLLPTGGTKPSTLTNQTFRGSTPSRSASPVTFAPRLLSCLHIDSPVTRSAARLHTGLAAHDYPGGTLTR